MAPSLSFLQASESGKGSSTIKKPSLSATDPKGEHQAKGEEGAGRAWQVFPPTEDPPGVLERDPLPADPSPYMLRAGQKPLLGSFSPRWHRKPRHCACLTTPSHSSPLTGSSGDTPCEALRLDTHSGAKVGDIFLGHRDSTWQFPRGWCQLCLSPKSQSIVWTLFQ